MKKTKTQKGITLIALIITIVVLLILAVVAIGAVRDSNIIGHAQNAAGSYNKAKANELDALATYETEIEKYLTEEKSDIQYYAVKGGGEGDVQEIVYALLKQGENHILKAYSGEVNGQLILLGEYNVYLEENKTATTIGTGDDAVTIKVGAIGISLAQGEQPGLYIQDDTMIAYSDGSAVIMTKATADVISRLSEGTTTQRRVEYYMPEDYATSTTYVGVMCLDYDNSTYAMCLYYNGEFTKGSDATSVAISEVTEEITTTYDGEKEVTILAGATQVSENGEIMFYIQDGQLYGTDYTDNIKIITDETMLSQLNTLCGVE